MDAFTLNVLRADDLLVLRFEFVNLVLDSGQAGAPPRLVRKAATDDALVIVHFPPQHIAEVCSIETNSGIEGLPGVGENMRSLIAGESRLAFRLPTKETSLLLTLESLLNWDRFEPLLADAMFETNEPKALGEPSKHHTAIELPFRLVLSPDEFARWSHRTAPLSRNGRSELWHTRMVTRNKNRTPIPSRMRAIWSPDHPDRPPQSDEFPMSLSSRERGEITRLSSEQGILAPDKFSSIPPDTVLPVYGPVPLRVDECILSGLGGWLRAYSEFNFPTLGPLLPKLKGHEMDVGEELFSLAEWRHIAAMGRDQYVRTVQRGFLYPCGHTADVVKITDRRFVPDFSAADRPACLIQQRFLVIQAQEVRCEHRDLPFVAFRIPSLVTPRLDAPSPGGKTDSVAFFVPMVDGAPFPFPVEATDHQGGVASFAMPMVFVPATGLEQLGDIAETYSRLGPVELSNQIVAFTAASGSSTADTRLKAATLQFTGMQDGIATVKVRPSLVEAWVEVPAAEQLVGSSGPVRITYHDLFKRGNAAPRGVFARIIDGLPLKFPAEKAGGVAAPELTMRALSVTDGAIPDVDGAQLLNDIKGKLLGVVDLQTIIGGALGPGEEPKVSVASRKDGQHIRLEWNTSLRNLQAPLAGAGGDSARLHLDGAIFRPRAAGEPTTHTKGVLSNFVLSLGDVNITFQELRFEMHTEQAPKFSAAVSDFSFSGNLAFVQALAQELQKYAGGFGGASGPSLRASPEGITAGFTLALPNIPVGVLNFHNIAFAAGLSLYFMGQPAEMYFRLSSRENPFLISYTIFGGGGFFELSVDTEGTLGVQASLQFGAVIALDLVIARGVVQAMAGIIFAMEGPAVKLGGFVRLFGSLEILRIITITVDLTLTLSYDSERDLVTGEARLLVMVSVLGYSESVSLTVKRSFSTKPDPRTFEENVSPAEWTAYGNAFA